LEIPVRAQRFIASVGMILFVNLTFTAAYYLFLLIRKKTLAAILKKRAAAEIPLAAIGGRASGETAVSRDAAAEIAAEDNAEKSEDPVE